jgi:hypothetical protein
VKHATTRGPYPLSLLDLTLLDHHARSTVVFIKCKFNNEQQDSICHARRSKRRLKS